MTLEEQPVVLMASRTARAGREHHMSELLAAVADEAVRSGGATRADVLHAGRHERRFAVILHFEEPAAVEQWTTSPARAALLEPIEQDTDGEAQIDILPELASAEPPPMPGPPRAKMAVVGFLAVTPLTLTVQVLLGPVLLATLSPVARALVLSSILVPAMTYVAAPLWSRVPRRWLENEGLVPDWRPVRTVRCRARKVTSRR
jgi:antibiotic biosynthesis monooxygenase (ABM) superfamily enzyme